MLTHRTPPAADDPSRQPRSDDMGAQRVGELLRPGDDILECAPDTPLYEAAALMRQRKCSSIVVVHDGQPLGIWTERDALRIDFSRPQALGVAIREVMSAPVRSISPGAEISTASERFRTEHIRHLLVVDDMGIMSGIISQTDIVRHQGLEHYLNFRTVGSILHGETERLDYDTPLSEAARRMRETRTDAVLVSLADDSWGILTERDLVHLIAERSENAIVGELATRPIFTVDANTSLYRVRSLMNERQIRHVGVVNGGGVINLLSFADLLSGLELAYVDQLRQALGERDQALAVSQRNLRLTEKVIENSLEGVLITDSEGIIEQVNPAFTRLTGYAPEEAIGKRPSLLSSGRHDEAFYGAMWESIKRFGHWQGEIWNRRRNGEIYPELLTITTIAGDDGKVEHYAALFSDISELKKTEQQIRHLAYYDPLTDLPNRRLFYDRLSMAIAHAHRHGQSLAVMFVDLDRFKNINDTLGHNVGDGLLEQVAQRLRRCLREGDTVARTGGDEFLILLPEVPHYDEAMNAAQRIIDGLTRPLHAAGRELVLTCSIGIAFYPEDGDNQDTLIKNADIAMYRAKEHGRNTYRLFTNTMDEQAQRRLRLETGLRQALEQNQIQVCLQPLVDAVSNRTVGAEALARWHHPEWGLIRPDEFIALAEETGQIQAIGQRVLELVVHHLARGGCVPIAVNLSPAQFADPNLLGSICNSLEHAGVAPGQLGLEITESVLMADAENHASLLEAVREKGIHVSIDDFGTGYSSLAYLRRFPLDYLKIDRSFVEELTDSADARAVVSATINLAHELRLKVVGEGVETPEQAACLREMGCDVLQGNLFGPPVTPEEFNRLHLPAAD
ncbi:EAL domain-containing protein [Acidihalobacter prosperus]